MVQRTFCSPSNEAEDIKGQVEYGKGSKGDEEQHNSKTPPSPDGQTGLKHTQTVLNTVQDKYSCNSAYTLTSLKIIRVGQK